MYMHTHIRMCIHIIKSPPGPVFNKPNSCILQVSRRHFLCSHKQLHYSAVPLSFSVALCFCSLFPVYKSQDCTFFFFFFCHKVTLELHIDMALFCLVCYLARITAFKVLVSSFSRFSPSCPLLFFPPTFLSPPLFVCPIWLPSS